MILIFWGAGLLMVYTYVGYPLLLGLVGKMRRKPIGHGADWPKVSLIISVYNGERIIQRKLDNCLALDYPPDLLEIIVASDCSTDGTHQIVERFGHPLRLVVSSRHLGKEAAQKLAIDTAGGEVLVFTDAGILLDPDALKILVANFADPTVGCVSGEDRVLDSSGDVVGEGAYVRYESLLRRLESRANSVVGMSGWLFALRQPLCSQWPEGLASDFYMLLATIKSGYRGLCEPRAVGYSWIDRSDQREFQRKVRTIVRGMAVVSAQRDLLNPLRYGFFAIQLWSHKVLRWMVPFFLVGLLGANAQLLDEGMLFRATFFAHIGFYLLAAAGSRWVSCRRWALCRIPYFFCMANVAILVAWWKYLRGARFVVWEPTPREADETAKRAHRASLSERGRS